jgi:hypothetical protein
MAEWIFNKHGVDVTPLYATPQPFSTVTPMLWILELVRWEEDPPSLCNYP